ncbi:hypothetical protein Tco_0923102 [Tanacetum coccineum]|uniref:Uncharacterized protein n=1 Tax=Tanacetum coccineum TaxID=301880 RepID=A0ABQ5D3B1_9ASTR
MPRKMQKEKRAERQTQRGKSTTDLCEEFRVKIRSHEESHYSESKTPTARTEPRRRRGDRSPSPRPRPRKEGGVFNRLGRREPATSARPDSRQQKGTHLVRPPHIQKVQIGRGVLGNLSQEGQKSRSTNVRRSLLSLELRKEILSHNLGFPALSLRGLDCPAMSKTYDEKRRSGRTT